MMELFSLKSPIRDVWYGLKYASSEFYFCYFFLSLLYAGHTTIKLTPFHRLTASFDKVFERTIT